MSSSLGVVPSRQKSWRTIFRRGIIIGSFCYGFSASLFLAIRMAAGEVLPVFALIDLFLPLLLIPALILFPLTLLLRGWVAAISLVSPVLLMITAYGPSFVPRATPAIASSGESISLLTYNLHAEEHVLGGMVNLIRESDADVVALQELSYPAASRFAQELKDIYPYQMLHPQHYANAGQGVLSRYPIVSDTYWRHHLYPDMLGHMRVEIDFKGTKITLYNTHPLRPVMRGLSFDDAPRRMEITDLLQRTSNDSGPILIAGDFNMPDQTDDYRRMVASFNDTYREIGWGLGLTFPDSNPVTPADDMVRRDLPLPLLFRLDYVFHNEDWLPLEARVWPTTGGSDHHPVFVRLALRSR